jgi:hypothetical protein
MKLRALASHLFVVGLIGASVGAVVACSSSSGAAPATVANDGGGAEGGGNGDGGGSDGAVDPGATTPEAIACDAYQGVIEAVIAKCTPALVPTAAPDILASRKVRERKFCLAQLALPGIGVTAQTLNDCAKAINVAQVKCDQLDSDPAFTKCSSKNGFGTGGTLADGAPCRTGAQCQGGLCAHPNGSGLSTDNSTCNITNGTCHTGVAVNQACDDAAGIICAFGADCVTKVCVANFSVAVGGDCNTNSTGAKGQNCAAGLTCSGGKCVAPAALNAPCAGGGSCQANLVCDKNVCVQGIPLGGDCSQNPSLCIDSFCEPMSNKCVGAGIVARPGEACGLLNGVIVSCVAGACLAATCPAIIPDGQPCTNGDSANTCDYLANCENKVCVLDSPICK